MRLRAHPIFFCLGTNKKTNDMFFATVCLGGGVAAALLFLSFFPPIRFPNRAFETSGSKGFVIDAHTRRAEWWSHRGKGRRHFIGEAVRGLRRRDRARVLEVLRLLRTDKASAYRMVPVSRDLHRCGSDPAMARLYAPLVWLARDSACPTVGAWADACEAWWSVP